MLPRLVPEIEGGYPERDGEEGGGEGLVLEYSRSWITKTVKSKKESKGNQGFFAADYTTTETKYFTAKKVQFYNLPQSGSGSLAG